MTETGTLPRSPMTSAHGTLPIWQKQERGGRSQRPCAEEPDHRMSWPDPRLHFVPKVLASLTGAENGSDAFIRLLCGLEGSGASGAGFQMSAYFGSGPSVDLGIQIG